jgi:hypothetical protein
MGPTLTALAGFFESRWDTPVGGLIQHEKALLLHVTGCVLRASGRFDEAAQAIHAGLEISLRGVEAAKSQAMGAELDIALQGAVMGTFNLSTLYLIMGDLKSARQRSEHGTKLAETSRKPFLECLAQTIHYNILCRQGDSAASFTVPFPGEELRQEVEREFRFVSYLQRYFACELLLMQERYEEVMGWVERMLRHDRLYADSGLDHLSIGYAHLLRYQKTRHNLETRSTLALVGDHLTQALERLRLSANNHHLPRAHLARAELHRLRGDLREAQVDVNTALSMASGGMRLYLPDCHLACARLHLENGQKARAQESLTTARGVLKTMCSTHWDQKVAELESQLRI